MVVIGGIIFSDISVRHAHSGLEQLLVPAALVWPLNLCLESRCQKKRSVEKSFLSLSCSAVYLERVIPQDSSVVVFLFQRNPSAPSQQHKVGGGLLGCSQKPWSAGMAGNVCWQCFISDFGSNSFYQSSGSPDNAIGEGF